MVVESDPDVLVAATDRVSENSLNPFVFGERNVRALVEDEAPGSSWLAVWPPTYALRS
jgi:hypothetical protein